MPAIGIKVLVIEDERDVRIYMTNLLRTHGFDAIAVSRAEEGLSKARSAKPALIVLDAMLPGDKAQQAFCELRCNPETRRIPVILLSTISRRALDRLDLYASGASRKHLPRPEAFLTKPPEAEDFIAVVHRLISPALYQKKEETL